MTGRRGRPPRGLSDEERALWLSVTSDLKPLRQDSDKPLQENRKSGETSSRPESARALRAQPAAAPKKALPELERGAVADLDKRQAQRLKRGQLAIDGRLDLHGFTQAEAHDRLTRYLAEAQSAGKRCVLVVTGRGVGKTAGGVLRAQVPRWLNEPANRRRVLAFDWAQPKHGGDGALYVLLKRNRP